MKILTLAVALTATAAGALPALNSTQDTATAPAGQMQVTTGTSDADPLIARAIAGVQQQASQATGAAGSTDDTAIAQSQVPLLADIPVIGHLFQQSSPDAAPGLLQAAACNSQDRDDIPLIGQVFQQAAPGLVQTAACNSQEHDDAISYTVEGNVITVTGEDGLIHTYALADDGASLVATAEAGIAFTAPATSSQVILQDDAASATTQDIIIIGADGSRSSVRCLPGSVIEVQSDGTIRVEEGRGGECTQTLLGSIVGAQEIARYPTRDGRTVHVIDAQGRPLEIARYPTPDGQTVRVIDAQGRPLAECTVQATNAPDAAEIIRYVDGTTGAILSTNEIVVAGAPTGTIEYTDGVAIYRTDAGQASPDAGDAAGEGTTIRRAMVDVIGVGGGAGGRGSSSAMGGAVGGGVSGGGGGYGGAAASDRGGDEELLDVLRELTNEIRMLRSDLQKMRGRSLNP